MQYVIIGNSGENVTVRMFIEDKIIDEIFPVSVNTVEFQLIESIKSRMTTLDTIIKNREPIDPATIVVSDQPFPELKKEII